MFTDLFAEIDLALKHLRDADVLAAEELVTAARLLDRFEAVFAQHARKLDLLGAHELDGFGSSRVWLAATTRQSVSRAGKHLRRGRYTYACEKSADAWHAGEISGEHVDEMERVRRRAHDDGAYALFEPALLDVARTASPSEVSGIGAQWLERLEALRDNPDPDGDEANPDDHGGDHGDDHGDDAGGLGVDESDANPFDGLLRDVSTFGFSETTCGFRLPYGSFTAADAAEILTALEAEADRLHSEGDRRSQAERFAEAFTSICRRYNSQDINEGRNTPHIVIGTELPVFNGESLGPIRTTNGIRLSRESMQRYACEAVVWIVTQDGKRQPLDLHRTNRTFTQAQRRAMERRDGHACCFPGCHAPASRAKGHHLHWWELDGPTNIENGMLLCYHHHTLVHEGRWTVHRTATGYRFWNPDRTRHRDFHQTQPHLANPPPPTPRR